MALEKYRQGYGDNDTLLESGGHDLLPIAYVRQLGLP